MIHIIQFLLSAAGFEGPWPTLSPLHHLFQLYDPCSQLYVVCDEARHEVLDGRKRKLGRRTTRKDFAAGGRGDLRQRRAARKEPQRREDGDERLAKLRLQFSSPTALKLTGTATLM